MVRGKRIGTVVWCFVTMLTTLLITNGHLILREIMARWPSESSWEGRLESAMYLQSAAILVGGVSLSAILLLRDYLARRERDQQQRQEHATVERNERKSAERHEQMLEVLQKLAGEGPVKKSVDSGAKPR